MVNQVIVCFGKAMPIRMALSTRKLLCTNVGHSAHLLCGHWTLPFLAQNHATPVESTRPIIGVKAQVHLVHSSGITDTQG